MLRLTALYTTCHISHIKKKPKTKAKNGTSGKPSNPCFEYSKAFMYLSCPAKLKLKKATVVSYTELCIYM